MKINWNYPTSMWVGENRVEDASKACKQLGISNPLFVTDKDLIKLDVIIFEKDDLDTRIKHIFLNKKGKQIFNEIFEIQKKRIYSALLESSSEEVISFDNVLKKIING